MKAAVETADLESFMATLAPDVVVRSPVSELAAFRGLAETRELMRGVFDTISDIRYYEELGDERARVVFYRARIGSQPIEEACRLRFDEQGRIRELTLWIRPMSGLTRLAAVLGPKAGTGAGQTASRAARRRDKTARLDYGERRQTTCRPGATEGASLGRWWQSRVAGPCRQRPTSGALNRV